MPRHSNERAPWRHVKHQIKRAVRTEQQSACIMWHFEPKATHLCGLLPLGRQLLNLSVIFHWHSKMASCATRETPAYEHFPLWKPSQSQHRWCKRWPAPPRPLTYHSVCRGPCAQCTKCRGSEANTSLFKFRQRHWKVDKTQTTGLDRNNTHSVRNQSTTSHLIMHGWIRDWAQAQRDRGTWSSSVGHPPTQQGRTQKVHQRCKMTTKRHTWWSKWPQRDGKRPQRPTKWSLETQNVPKEMKNDDEDAHNYQNRYRMTTKRWKTTSKTQKMTTRDTKYSTKV